MAGNWLRCRVCPAKTFGCDYWPQAHGRRAGPFDHDGYLLVLSLLDERVLARLRSRLEEVVRQTIAAWQADPDQKIAEPGVVRVNLDAQDRDFAPSREHPLPADAATAVLGADWQLSDLLLLRAPLPGCGHRGLHPDFAERRGAQPVADAIGHVVHLRIHPGQRPAAGHPGLAPGD